MEAYSDSRYASDCGDQKSISRYYTFVGGNLVTWRSKKNTLCLSLSLSSDEVEYCAIMHASFEMLWVRSFLEEIGFPV